MLCSLLRDPEWGPRIISAFGSTIRKTVCWSPLLIFLTWLVGSPLISIVVPRVETGTLYALDMEENGTAVTYNISALFSFSNPGNNFQVSINEIAAEPLYGGQKLGPDASLPTFKLPSNQTMMVPMEVEGRQVLDGSVATMYAEDAGRGFFTIQVKLHVKEGDDGEDFLCTLQFPAPTESWPGTPNLFDGDECIPLS